MGKVGVLSAISLQVGDAFFKFGEFRCPPGAACCRKIGGWHGFNQGGGSEIC